jgi:hypothetical protein
MKGMNEMKQIYAAENLPDALRAELAALLDAMKAKYGPAAVRLGVHIENMATVINMVGSNDLTPEQRKIGRDHAAGVLGSLIKDLGTAARIDPEGAFAVAKALQEYSRHVESEMLGEQPASAEAIAETAKALAKAAAF